MKEVEQNKKAWGSIAADHYAAFKKRFAEGLQAFNPYIEKELGDLSGKCALHLQCNTGADTILLARKCARAVGVDLVPDNIFYAKKLAADLGVENVDFFESDIMTLKDKYNEKYDVVFVSEGSLVWLPDFRIWAQTVRHFLKDDGFFYVFDEHPFYLSLDKEKMANSVMDVKYPYFDRTPDEDDAIGGYASEQRKAKNYCWQFTVSDVINSLTEAGFHVNYFNEYPELFYNNGGMNAVFENSLYDYPFNGNKFPMSFSLKATVYNKK